MNVAVDQGVAGAQAIGSDGKPVEKLFKLELEMDLNAARHMAKSARIIGQNAVADRIDGITGSKSYASWFEKNPVKTGLIIGVAVTGVSVGGYVLGRRWYRSRQLQKTAGHKVVPIRAAR